jgi:acetyltransferase-like isoleucine patch superfamily enzyme
MSDAQDLVARLGRRAGAVARRTRRCAGDLRSPRRTALRIPEGRVVPPPRAFARFGEGSWIVPPARIEGAAGIEIGAKVVLLEDSGLHVRAEEGARRGLGDRVRLGKGAEIVCTLGVTVGTAVSGSDYVTISDAWVPDGLRPASSDGPVPPAGAPIVIEDGAYLGWGCLVGPGVRIGRGAYVGEGAVVLDDVPSHGVVYGNPAVLTRPPR